MTVPAEAPAERTWSVSPPTPRAGGLRWVLDSGDDVACVREMTALHNLGAGRVVCPTRPGATWPVLVRDLLVALGKHPAALTRERRTRHGAELLRVWLRAEGVRHLVVLRGHLLAPEVLARLADLADTAGSTVWPVWHRPGLPGVAATVGIALPWPRAAAGIRDDRPAAAGLAPLYARMFRAARAEGHRWRTDPPAARPRRFALPGCVTAAVVQRLTIDASTDAELQTCLRAARDGFRTAGMRLQLPDPAGPNTLAGLGPRLTPDTIARLRLLVCPASAAAFMLALATDADAACLNSCLRHFIAPDASQVHTLGGDYRVPAHARPLLHAALLYHQDHGASTRSVFAVPRAAPPGPSAMLGLIHRTARLTDLPAPRAACAGTGFHAAAPFAATYTGAVTIDRPDPEPLHFSRAY